MDAGALLAVDAVGLAVTTVVPIAVGYAVGGADAAHADQPRVSAVPRAVAIT